MFLRHLPYHVVVEEGRAAGFEEGPTRPGVRQSDSLGLGWAENNKNKGFLMEISSHINANVAHIQLNTPHTLNALTLNMGQAIKQLLSDIDHNPDISVIVLESSVGKAFSAGIDLKEFQTNPSQEYRKAFLSAWESVSNVSKPIIVALHGYVLGGGLEVALIGDILIAADNAVFSQPELSVGTIPGMGATQRLSRRIGVTRAYDMILTGRRIDAATAYNWGLVSAVVPFNQLQQTVNTMAQAVATKSLPILIKAKSALKRSESLLLPEGLACEKELFLQTFSLADQQEGFCAFIEKRPPIFKNV